jgi:hypothetical protein
MLYGLIALVILWLAMVLLVWLPAGIEPAWWLLPLLAVSLVWMQAICWAIPRPPVLQVVAVCVIFPILKFCLELIMTRAGYVPTLVYGRDTLSGLRGLSITIFTLYAMPTAYAVAFVGVLRVRHGINLPRLSGQYLHQLLAEGRPILSGGLSSPVGAQLGYELRRKAILFLPLFALALATFVKMVAAPFVTLMALACQALLLISLLLVAAYCVGYGMGKPHFWGELGVAAWDAVKPVSSGFIALAKLRALAVTSFLTCMMVFVVVPLLFWHDVAEAADAVMRSSPLASFSEGQIWALPPIAFAVLFVLIWAQAVGGFSPSATGREWIVNGVALFSFALVAAFGISLRVISLHPDGTSIIWTSWTWVAGTLVTVKLMAALCCLQIGLKRDLVQFRELVPSLCICCLGLGSLLVLVHVYLLPIWHRIFANDVFVAPMPPLLATLLAILALPLLRLTASPVAVAWGTHR